VLLGYKGITSIVTILIGRNTYTYNHLKPKSVQF